MTLTRVYRFKNGTQLEAQDACHALLLLVEKPPRGLKTGTYDVTIVNTSETVTVNWDGHVATMIWT